MLDDRDTTILADRVTLLNAQPGPRRGDFVRFRNGHTRRVASVWRNSDGIPVSIQTCDDGSFYLGDGYTSMSGSLFAGVKPETLTRADETREGDPTK